MKSWFCKRGERVIGPFSIETLHKVLSAGKLLNTDFVSESEQGPWRTVADSPALLPVAPNRVTTSEISAPVDNEDTSPPVVPVLDDIPAQRPTARWRDALMKRPAWQLGLLGGIPALVLGLVIFLIFTSDPDSPPKQEDQVVQVDLEAQQKIDDLNRLLGKLQEDLDNALEEKEEENPAPVPVQPAAPQEPQDNDPPAVQEKVEPPEVVQEAFQAAEVAPDLKALVAKVEPAVVRIDVVGIDGRKSLGSGFLVDQAGIIVTNFHVIEGAAQASVTFSDGTKTKVVGFFAAIPERDLALLEIEDVPDGAVALSIIDENDPPVKGERIAAFGNPKGLDFSVSEGIVGALRSGQQLKDSLGEGIYEMLGYAIDCRWIQHSAGTTNGNSGGPIINLDGKVIGIHTLGIDGAGGKLNFAVDARELRQHLPLPGAMVQDLAQLPKPAKGMWKVNPIPLFPPRINFNLGAWLAKQRRLQNILDQRIILFKERDRALKLKANAKAKGENHIRNLRVLQNDLNGLTIKNQRDLADYREVINVRIKYQRQLGFANRQQAQVIQAEIQKVLNIEFQFKQVLTANNLVANQLQTRIGVELAGRNAAQRDYVSAQNQENQITTQANGLRMEWLTVVNPFDSVAHDEYQLALQQCGDWVALDGDFFGPYWLRAAVHTRMGNFAAAHRDMGHALRLSQNYSPLYAEMLAVHGWVYLVEKRDKEHKTAIKVLAASTKLYKQCQAARVIRGMVEQDIGKDHFQKAKAEFKAGVNLAPGNLIANYYYARLLAMCPFKKYRAGPLAVKHAEIACEASNWKGPECLFVLANAHFEAGNEKEAFGWYAAAIGNARHKRQATYYHLCLQQVKLGKPIRLPAGN